MRIVTSAVAAAAMLAFQVSPVLSQTTTPEPAPPAASALAAPASPAPSSVPEATAPTTPPRKSTSHAKRMSMHQRFVAANASKDGQLTLDQANAAKWSAVSRNFAAIDKDRKGYVTEADIRAYTQARHAARRPIKAAAPAPAAPALQP